MKTRATLFVAMLLLLWSAGCKNKNKGRKGPVTTHYVAKPMASADLEAKVKAFVDANEGDWKAKANPFTGYIVSGSRPAAEKDKPKRPDQASAVGMAREFVEKNAKYLGIPEELIDVERIDVSGAPGGKNAPGRWLIVVRGQTWFPHAEVDNYDLGDRLEMKLVVMEDGVLQFEVAPILPDPKLPPTGELAWNDPSITKQLGGKKPTNHNQAIHVTKTDDAITYKMAWRIEVGDEVMWFDGSTGEKLSRPSYDVAEKPKAKSEKSPG